MASHKYKIREICGDWALDIHWGMETITLFFNSRNNADLVKAILEWEDAHPNEAVPYKPALTPPNEWVSVEDAMPPEHEPVLCIVDGKPKPNITLEDAYQIGSWNKADGWIIDEYLDWEDADVSWWMSLPAPPDKDNNVLAKTPNEPLTLEHLRASPHGKIKDSTLQSICNRANEIACRPPEGEEDTK